MRTVYPSPLLKSVLAIDAVVSGAVALLQLAAAGWLSERLQLPQALLVETGAFLVAYTVLLVALARSARVSSAIIGAIVLGNVAWAAGCVALLATDGAAPGGLGTAYVVVQALAVLGFAALEYVGVRGSEPAPDGHAAAAR